jgi:hypothetical protein
MWCLCLQLGFELYLGFSGVQNDAAQVQVYWHDGEHVMAADKWGVRLGTKMIDRCLMKSDLLWTEEKGSWVLFVSLASWTRWSPDRNSYLD